MAAHSCIPKHVLEEIQRRRRLSNSVYKVCRDLNISLNPRHYDPLTGPTALEEAKRTALIETIKNERNDTQTELSDEEVAQLYLACPTSTRIRIPGYEDTLEHAIQLIKERSSIVIVCGAGTLLL